jgi:hypothetical protein
MRLVSVDDHGTAFAADRDVRTRQLLRASGAVEPDAADLLSSAP